jgi:hypothetical protein
MRALHAIHRGEPIWIAGSGPSLSGYPDGFTDGKVLIALHLAHVKFPRATWRYANEYDRAEYLAEPTRIFAIRRTCFRCRSTA